MFSGQNNTQMHPNDYPQRTHKLRADGATVEMSSINYTTSVKKSQTSSPQQSLSCKYELYKSARISFVATHF